MKPIRKKTAIKEADLPESRAAVGVGGENQDWRKQKIESRETRARSDVEDWNCVYTLSDTLTQ